MRVRARPPMRPRASRMMNDRPDDARREVGEILEAFRGNPRVIIGTGDQVGHDTPEANLLAMIETGKRYG